MRHLPGRCTTQVVDLVRHHRENQQERPRRPRLLHRRRRSRSSWTRRNQTTQCRRLLLPKLNQMRSRQIQHALELARRSSLASDLNLLKYIRLETGNDHQDRPRELRLKKCRISTNKEIHVDDSCVSSKHLLRPRADPRRSHPLFQQTRCLRRKMRGILLDQLLQPIFLAMCRRKLVPGRLEYGSDHVVRLG